MAANTSHLNDLFSTVLIHNILIFFMLSTSSLMRCQTFADCHRHCAMREGGGDGYFWSKKGIGRTVLFKWCTSHPADMLRPHENGHYIRFAPNYSYFDPALHRVPVRARVRCPSLFYSVRVPSVTCIASRLVQYHTTGITFASHR